MPATEPSESGSQARTRRAILDAAVAVFAQQRTASLSDVAGAASVGRSTLHRYFPDRASLVGALLEDAVEATRRAFSEAALDQGTPVDALRRLIHAQFELGARMEFLFNEMPDAEWESQAFEAAHRPVGELIARGQVQGTFDAQVSIDWIVRVLWYLVSAGWEAVGEGAMAKHEAIANIIRTLENGLVARPQASR